MAPQFYIDIFRTHYGNPANSIDSTLMKLRENGATQAICTLLLIAELKMSLEDADRIVINSTAWETSRDTTHEFRKKFGDIVERQNEEE